MDTNKNQFSQVLIFMGCKGVGKTTLGKLLAQKYDADFYDTDDMVYTLNGKTPRQIYKEQGAASFMIAEENACREIIKIIRDKGQQDSEKPSNYANIVISTGGGICDNTPALSLLRDLPSSTFIHLRYKVFSIVEKQMEVEGEYPAYITEKKPVTEEEVRDLFTKRFSRRLEQYNSFCDICIDMKKASENDNLNVILEALQDS